MEITVTFSDYTVKLIIYAIIYFVVRYKIRNKT